MKFIQRDSGLLIPEESRIVDIGRTIDEHFSKTGKKGIYVPNQYAVKKISRLSKLAAGLMLLLSLYTTGCAANRMVLSTDAPDKPAATSSEKPGEKQEKKETGEIKVFQFYNTKDGYGFTKTELSGKLPGNISAWGFIETDGKGYFALTTATREIYKPLFAALAHRSGDGIEDHLHAGLKLKGKPFGQDYMFVCLKAMQKIDSDTDTKLGIYVSADIADWLSFEAMYDRDVRAESYYAEGSLIFKPFKDTDFENLEFLLQGRSAGSIHHRKHEDGRYPIDVFLVGSLKF